MTDRHEKSIRRVPRFAQSRNAALEVLQDQVTATLRKQGFEQKRVDGTTSLCSPQLHKLIATAASEHFWTPQKGLRFPEFDSSKVLTLNQALDFFEF